MTRTPLKRTAGMKRSPMKRKRKKVSAEERKYGEFIRTQRCESCCGVGLCFKVEAAHTGGMKHGAGWELKADWQRMIPLCRWCHRDGPRSYHAVGSEPKWCAMHRINLDTTVARLRAAYGEATNA